LEHPQGLTLWRFSLEVYGRPGVAQACVALQDEHGVDVNVLLCLLWLGAAGCRLSPVEVRAIDDRVAHWRDAVVAPLRALRRGLRTPPSLGDPAAVEALRERVKAVELEAERLEQEKLQALSTSALFGRHAEAAHAAAGNVAAYQEMLGCEFSRDTVAVLLAAVPGQASDR
jgi:uncharacterized protein (TIGR02444 family)